MGVSSKFVQKSVRGTKLNDDKYVYGEGFTGCALLCCRMVVDLRGVIILVINTGIFFRSTNSVSSPDISAS
jgi:hypothetical protein